MRHWKPLLLTSTLLASALLVFASLAVHILQEQHAEHERQARLNRGPVLSPLSHDADIQKIQHQWQAELLLPTQLEGHHYLRKAEAKHTNQGLDELSLEMDLLISDSTQIAKLMIDEKKTSATSITAINGQPVADILNAPQDSPHLGSGHVRELEPIKWEGGSGYWYYLHSGAHGQYRQQQLEFIQDGYHVTVALHLSEGTLPKERLIAIAKSFQFIEVPAYMK